MTKKVRIENADTSNFKVKVEVWAKGGRDDGHGLSPERPGTAGSDGAVRHRAQRYVSYIPKARN